MSEERCSAEVQVVNALGVHARPSHAIVTMAANFQARIQLSHDGRTADARSILSVMTLGATQGALLRIEAEGPDARAAVEALGALIASGFQEER